MCLPCLNLQWLMIVKVIQDWTLPSLQPRPLPLPLGGRILLALHIYHTIFGLPLTPASLFLLLKKYFSAFFVNMKHSHFIRLRSDITSPSKPSLFLFPQSGFAPALCAQRMVRCHLSWVALISRYWNNVSVSVSWCGQPEVWLVFVPLPARRCPAWCLEQCRSSH